MRILFLSNVFPQPHSPLRGIYSLRLCAALADRHEVRVISPWSWADRLRHQARGGTAGGPGPNGLAVEYPWYVYPPGVLRQTYGWFMWASARRCIRRTLAEFRPDCVVSYWAHPDGAVAIRAARRAGVSAAVMIGGSDALLLAGGGSRRRPILRVLREADAVITVGRDLRDRVVQFGVPPERAHVVERGIDTDRFRPGDRADARRRLGLPVSGPVMLWVGNMVPVKGLDVLLAACGRLAERGEQFRLCLIGHGPLRAALEQEVERRDLTGVVKFVGSVPQEGLPDWYRAADLTVLPSRSEGVPNVLRESLACGTPFVASEVGGIPELTRDPVSRLVPAGDPAALAEAVRAALAESRAAGPVRVQASGSWAESADALVRILRPLVGARSSESDRRPHTRPCGAVAAGR